MSNRWFRFVVALLAISAAGAAGYRIFQQERHLSGDVTNTRAAEDAADAAIVAISELKAALHAYVAAGQGQPFWTARASMLTNSLRASIVEVDQGATAVGAPLTETLDLADRLGASEERARDHLRNGQALLAGEVIFTEARDLLDAMRVQIAGARDHLRLASGARITDIRREQTMLALGALGVLTLAVLLLVIPSRGSGAVAAELPADTPVTLEPVIVAPVVATAQSLPFADAAAVCTDLGRVVQTTEISALLARAADVLGASGVIVWMSSANRDELYPAAYAGYDDRMVARIGSIPRGAANLTAAAFRAGAARSSAGLGPSAAALAAPLLTPQGPVGVFSAELRDVAEVDATRLALATIFAAQLAMLLGSMAPAAEVAATSDLLPKEPDPVVETPPAQQAQA
ncbi:MAG TPA: hypothetical protein VNJ02_04570 [Vicinamibacterales bacterium]|nr:hypothetical protein [Vicinamibacterales bacterium]